MRVSMIASLWATSMRCGTGAMPEITWRCSGGCCNKKHLKICNRNRPPRFVRHFIELSARSLGWGELRCEGHGPKEVGRRTDTNAVVIRIDPRYFRPAEVETLLGDASEAHKRLGWKPCITLEELVEEMITQDREDARKEAYLRREGFQVVGPRE